MPDPTNLSVQQVVLAGLKPAYTAADANGNTFLNSGRAFLHVKNGDASDHTVTVNSLTNCNQGHDHNIAVVVTAGEERMIGPFDRTRFNNSTTGKVGVSYDAVTSVTVAVVEVP